MLTRNRGLLLALLLAGAGVSAGTR